MYVDDLGSVDDQNNSMDSDLPFSYVCLTVETDIGSSKFKIDNFLHLGLNAFNKKLLQSQVLCSTSGIFCFP